MSCMNTQWCYWVWICSTQSRNLHNLEIALCILRIWKLHANLEIAQPNLHLYNTFTQSWDCGNAIHKLNGVIEVRASKLTMFNWQKRGESSVGEAFGDTQQVWGLTAPAPRPRGRECLQVGELPMSQHARCLWWQWSCNRPCRITLA